MDEASNDLATRLAEEFAVGSETSASMAFFRAPLPA
jgi:hypothetical protein